MPTGLLALEQLALFTRQLSTQALLRQASSLLSLRALECVQSPSDRLSVDVELSGERSLALAPADPPADLLDVGVRELGVRSHTISLVLVGHLLGHMR